MRQLVVAIDACEWTLVRRWADAGKLPTFARLLAEGASGSLTTTAGQLPDTVWSCVYGGRNPATFEKYFYVQYDPGTGDLRHVRDDAFTTRPFWDVLSEAGRTVGVFDVVKHPASRAIRGFHVANWGAHATKTPRASTPAALLPALTAAFGAHPVGDCDAVDATPRSRRDLRQRVLAGVRLRGAVLRHLMQHEPWDVLVAGFSEPHCIGHHFWHRMDAARPPDQGVHADGLADSIEQVYRAMDAEIGSLVALAGPDTLVLAVSGHGMGPLRHASWHLPEILDRLGFGEPGTRANGASSAAPRAARSNHWRTLKRVVPGRLQYAIKNRLPQRLQDELLFRWYAGERDWRRRRAFAVPNNDSVGAIRLNVRGRDRFGTVAPEDYDRLVAEITAELLALRDPATRRPVVRRVTKTREAFTGSFLDGLPDLTVAWDASFPWRAVTSARLGTLTLRDQDGRSGGHTDHGFVIVAGPGVPRGVALDACSIYDIAPTILRAADVALPSELEGRPLPIFNSAAMR